MSELISVADSAPTDVPGSGLRAHWFRPTRASARNGAGVVCLPIQGGDYEVSTLFAEYFAGLGYHTLRFERRAEWLDPDLPLDVLARLVPRFVADVSRVLDEWLGRDDAPDRIGLFGVSMGAMTGTLLAAADPRVGPVTLCIGGANLDDVLVEGNDTELNEWRDELSRRLGSREAFNAAARELVGAIDLVEAARTVDPERVLFVGARFDRVVPWSASVRLWEALRRPKRIVLPTGHYSAVVGVPWIKRSARLHFDARFGF